MKIGALKIVGYIFHAVTCESIGKLYRFVIKIVTSVVILREQMKATTKSGSCLFIHAIRNLLANLLFY